MEPTDEQLKSELILGELKRRQCTREVVDVEEQQIKVIIFICGRNRYAFFGGDIREILPSCEISWVPCLPDFLPGLINVRGDIESVMDIRHFLGEEKTEHGTSMIAMAVKGDFRTGVMIDSIVDVVDIPVSALKSPLATLNSTVRDLVTGEIEYGGGLVTLLDVGKLATMITL